MNGLKPADFDAMSEIGGMAPVFTEVRTSSNTICYTFNNYKDR